MDTALLQNLLGITLAALIGGLLARALKLQPILGYLVTGVLFGAIFPSRGGIYDVAQIGVVLLLFSTGIELSFEKLIRVLKPALIGATFQIIATILVLEFFLVGFGFDNLTSLIFALGLSLSSTVVVVKILSDRGESDTIHGELITGWLIAQDLAVIPMLVVLPVLAGHGGGNLFIDMLLAFLKTIVVVGGTFVLGNFLGPRFIHFITSFNSRELLVLGAISLALGTAMVSSVFGIAPAIGAFLAGVVISRSQESHAIFAETRPLRDLFVAMFFVIFSFTVFGLPRKNCRRNKFRLIPSW
ncbi:cation:proton antiporter [Candidatus Woesebacteria bacterium]|nr:cation:proton antiporter [Candidatus Woesebacteria bacterium]